MTKADAKLYGKGLVGPLAPAYRGPLQAEFGAPPFSVLDARQGPWQARKRRWLALGIDSHEGRPPDLMKVRGSKTGLKRDGTPVKASASLGDKDTSIFDPVLCELLYRWFCPAGGQVVDPFAGGSVRGIVASVLGLRYWGMDIRPEQVAANVAQATPARCGQHKPRWACGDSRFDLADSAPEADFLFTCPPYGNLEKYSDLPGDLSNHDDEQFDDAYRDCIIAAGKRLKRNRFAAFVVGNYRSKYGALRDLVGWTTDHFCDAGLYLYNEAILVTAVSTASMRARVNFNGSRKLTRTHQNVLVYCKGDAKLAAKEVMGGG